MICEGKHSGKLMMKMKTIYKEPEEMLTDQMK